MLARSVRLVVVSCAKKGSDLQSLWLQPVRVGVSMGSLGELNSYLSMEQG